MNETTGRMGDPIISPLLVVGFTFHRRKLLQEQRFKGPVEN